MDGAAAGAAKTMREERGRRGHRGSRAPLLPRADLSNQSPDSAATNGGKPRQPPLPPPNKRKHPAVRSSGYGRAGGGSRPPPPLDIERRLISSRSLPASPANSVASASSVHSAASRLPTSSCSLPSSPANSVASASSVRSAAPRLRHGDGSFFLGNTITATSNRNNFKKPTARSRARSPTPVLSRHPDLNDAVHDRNKAGRSRTPSPAIAKRLHRRGSGNGGPPASAFKKLKAGCAGALPLLVTERVEQRRPRRSTSPQQRTAAPSGRSDDEVPLPSRSASTAAPAPSVAGASSPLSATKSFQPPTKDDPVAQSSAANSYASPPTASLFEGLDDPGRRETSSLSSQLFSRESGIDNAGLRRLLSKSNSNSKGAVKQWELRKRLECKEEELALLRVALRNLLGGKDAFVAGVADIEAGLRRRMFEAKCALKDLVRQKSTLENGLQGERDGSALLREKIQEVMRERDDHSIRHEMIQNELDSTKVELARSQQRGTENAVALALLESKVEESAVQREAAEAQAAGVKAAQADAIKEATSKVTAEMSRELSRVQDENKALREEVRAWRAREERVCRLMELGSVSVDFTATNDYAANSFLTSIKQRVEEYKKDAALKNEAEKIVEAREAELEKVKADYQASLETLATKNRDMMDLMKSINDIQQSGQDCQQQAAKAEGQVLKCREQLLSLGCEKKLLEEALDAARLTCTSHEGTIANLQEEIATCKVKCVQHDAQLQLERDLRIKVEEKATEEKAERVALAAQLNAQLREHAASEKRLREGEWALRDQIRLGEEEAKTKQAEIVKYKETIAALEAHQLSLKRSLSEKKSMFDASKEEEIGRLRGEVANLESRLKTELERMHNADVANEAKVKTLEDLIRRGQEERKRMHNIIQDLRGNVRVFARIRPFLPDEREQGDEGETKSFVLQESDAVLSVMKPHDPRQKHKFTFDRVFPPSIGQEFIFEEVSEFVQSALDGYNVCLLSYGQTGSGKTHTMTGTGTGVMRGIIPRSIEQISIHKNKIEDNGWEFNMEISSLEIYNENIKDLLGEHGEKKHEIKVCLDGRRTVSNLTVKPIDPSDRNSVEAVLSLAMKRRSTASTDMNTMSSRSHLVFTLNLTAKHHDRNQIVRGALNLVDLAGSERLDRSNVAGQEAKETMSINKSLSSLTDVFTAIGQKRSHVPFRNSKLTYLLQPALSGDGKTLMLVNISPTEASVQESMCSLRFASKVNRCELGKAKRTIEEVKNNEGPEQGNSGKDRSVGHDVRRKIPTQSVR